MPRPVAKNLNLNNPAASLSVRLCDANVFADVFGVSPSYKQKETLRWNSAMQMYKQMSSQDLTKLPSSLDGVGGVRVSSSVYSLSSAIFQTQLHHSPLTCIGSNGCVQHATIPAITGDGPAARRMSASPDRHRRFGDGGGAAEPRSRHFCGLASPPPSPASCDGGGAAPRHAGADADADDACLKRNAACAEPQPQPQPHPPVAALAHLGGLAGDETSLNALELQAIGAVHELRFAVRDVFVSDLLPRTSTLIFLNVTTLDGQAYCVELTRKGWRVTSLRHDCMNGDLARIDLHTRYFRTAQALVDAVSALALTSALPESMSCNENHDDDAQFRRALAEKLQALTVGVVTTTVVVADL